MAKKNKNKKGGGLGIKKQLKQVADGGISKSEFNAIAEATGATNQQIVKRMDSMNQKGKNVRLNSGAANMLIKQSAKNPYTTPSYGDGRIAKSLTSMMGSPGYTPPSNSKAYGSREAVAPQLMIGGTQIKPGGRVAVRRPSSNTAATNTRGAGPYDGMMDGTPSTPGVDPGPWASGYVNPNAGTATPMTGETASPASYADAVNSYEGMTGGGSGLSGAMGLRRAFSRWRSQNRGTQGTNNFRRFLQIGAPNINLN